MSHDWEYVDPFDLPDWLGVDEVTWVPREGLRGGLVSGTVRSEASPECEVACDLLGADVAFPSPVLPDEFRVPAHQAWARDEVLLLSAGGRLTLAAPGTEHSADRVLEMLRRFAKAVGSRPERFAARLFLAAEHSACGPT